MTDIAQALTVYEKGTHFSNDYVIIVIKIGGMSVEKLLDIFLTRLLFLMKLSMLFMVLLVIGGVIFGFSPASASLLAMYHAYGTESSKYTYSEAIAYFKRQFWASNRIFILVLAIALLLLYSVFLMIQLPQTLLTVMVSVVNVFLVLYLYCLYMCYLKLQIYYEFGFRYALKLSAMSVFFDWFAMFKLLCGTALCLLLTFKVTITLAVFLPTVWLLFAYDVLEPIYTQIEKAS